MGNRAIVIVEGASCGLYLHCTDAVEVMQQASGQMRENDPDYAQARLIGVAHAMVSGVTGVGVLPPPDNYEDGTLRDYGHGDQGVFVIRKDGSVDHFAAFGENRTDVQSVAWKQA